MCVLMFFIGMCLCDYVCLLLVLFLWSVLLVPIGSWHRVVVWYCCCVFVIACGVIVVLRVVCVLHCVSIVCVRGIGLFCCYWL